MTENPIKKEKMSFKCPECQGETKLVHVSRDGKAKFYQCKRGHKHGKVVQHPVFMVEEN